MRPGSDCENVHCLLPADHKGAHQFTKGITLQGNDSSMPAGEINEPCDHCAAPFADEIADGMGSVYECGSAVTFIDGMGLVWERTWGCEQVAALRAEVKTHRGFIEEMTQANDALRADNEILRTASTWTERDLARVNIALRADLVESNLLNEQQHAAINALRDSRDEWKSECLTRNETARRWQAEVERMRPVVDAACEWRTVYVSDADAEWNPKMAAMQQAVDAYREATNG